MNGRAFSPFLRVQRSRSDQCEGGVGKRDLAMVRLPGVPTDGFALAFGSGFTLDGINAGPSLTRAYRHWRHHCHAELITCGEGEERGA